MKRLGWRDCPRTTKEDELTARAESRLVGSESKACEREETPPSPQKITGPTRR
jgi:hypothetical protein